MICPGCSCPYPDAEFRNRVTGRAYTVCEGCRIARSIERENARHARRLAVLDRRRRVFDARQRRREASYRAARERSDSIAP